MPDPSDEEQLERSKMSFSDHLEELRTALFKSLGALLVGSLLGLLVGWSVVDYIQTPIRHSLETYFRRQAEHLQLERLEEMRAAGEPVPDDLEAAAEELADRNLMPRNVYVPRGDLQRALRQDVPGGDANEEPPPAVFSAEDLIRLRVYEPLDEDSRLSLVGQVGS